MAARRDRVRSFSGYLACSPTGRHTMRSIRGLSLFLAMLLLASVPLFSSASDQASARQRFLYVASPGVRDYLEWGGHGVLVFDINNRHKFVKRIRLDGYGLSQQGSVLNVKGICASAKTN